ncbi:MAG TPA: TIGR03668 family PPOX class F420-dependent oxidoreductase [Ktedonobacterales bacterium]|jgi:PPOX class probable F420-dependent enzyme|nr:TIGR03668 family PPOX class F420-dependent oxidoreductase [Ktedonobacterales bacterium]
MTSPLLGADALAFIQTQRVARLATADASGRPHVVPVCYAFESGRFYIALDEKPKRADVMSLRRVRNILARSDADLLIDHYDDDWSKLGYVLAHTRASLLMPDTPEHAAERARGIEALRARYTQYRTMALERLPLIALEPERYSMWGPAVDGAAVAADDPWMRPGRGLDFLPLARGRRSVRAFQSRPVPSHALEDLLVAASWAPSPHGRQPWRFVVLTQPEPKARLAEAMGADWRDTLAQDGQPTEVVEARLRKSHERIREAPALVLACLYLDDLDRYPDAERQRAEETMAIQSLGAAIQNMLLAAYAMGLDTGWMCAPLFSPETVRVALDLAPALIPHALIPIGYAARDPRRRSRRPLDDLVVRWE